MTDLPPPDPAPGPRPGSGEPNAAATPTPPASATPTPKPPASRRSVLAAGAVSVAALVTAGVLGAPRPARLGEPSGDESLAAELSPHLDGHSTVSAALIDGSHTSFAGFGADEHQEYEIGSISKTFTAALVMDAVTRREIGLDSSVEDLLGDRAHGTGVADRTIAQLASHTAGLPSLPSAVLLRNLWAGPLRVNPYRNFSTDDLWDAAIEVAPEETGSFSYSNMSAALEGNLTARASGTGHSWAALLRMRIIDPLGLTETRVPAPDADEHGGWTANGHRSSAWTMDGMAPAGAVRSTAADVARWLMSMMDGTNPGSSGLDPIASAGDGGEVAVNWFLDPGQKGTIIWHNGETGGFHAFAGYVRETGRGVALLSDTADGSLDDLGFAVLDQEVAA